MHISVSSIIALLQLSAICAARCYDLVGTAFSDDSFQPCDPDAEVSACCATNKAQPDICIQGGLCYATMDSYSGYIYGNGCEDATGGDDACPYACPAKANGWGSFNVLQCALGTWCCREASDRTNCCSNSSMLISGTQTSYLGRFLNTTSSSTTDANGTTVVTNVTTTEISTITATASSSSSSSTTVVGAAVGAVLGVAFIAALSGLLWAMNKIKNMKKEMEAIRRDSCANTSALMAKQEPYYMPQQTNGPEIHAYEADNHQRHEIDGIAK